MQKKKFGFHNFAEHRLRTSVLEGSTILCVLYFPSNVNFTYYTADFLYTNSTDSQQDPINPPPPNHFPLQLPDLISLEEFSRRDLRRRNPATSPGSFKSRTLRRFFESKRKANDFHPRGRNERFLLVVDEFITRCNAANWIFVVPRNELSLSFPPLSLSEGVIQKLIRAASIYRQWRCWWWWWWHAWLRQFPLANARSGAPGVAEQLVQADKAAGKLH